MPPIPVLESKPKPAPDLRTSFPRIAFVLLPIVPLLAYLFFPSLAFVHPLIIWMGCLNLFVLTYVIKGQINENLSRSYRGLSVLTTWLILDIGAALVLLLCAGTLHFALAYIRANKNRSQAKFNRLAASTIDMITMSGITLLASWFVYTLCSGLIPLQHLTANTAFSIVALLVTYFVSSEISRYLILHRLRGDDYHPIWSEEQRSNLLIDLMLLPVIIILPMILANDGITVFILSSLVVTIFGLYLFQTYANSYETEQDHQKSAELVRKLALVNQTAQNAMFRVDQELALQTACQTAASITQANRAALFVAERDSDTLSLVESVGFTEAEQANGLNLALMNNQQFEPAAYIVPDITTFTGENPLHEFNQHINVASFAAVPLLSGNALLGYLAVYHNQPHQYTTTELELINILTDRVAAALDNAHLLDTLEFHAFEMTHLVHLSRISTASLKLEQVAADVTNVLRQMSAMDWAMIALLDDTYVLMNVVGFSGITTNGEIETFQYKLPQFEEVVAIRNMEVPRPRFIRSDEANLSLPLRSYMEIHALRSLVIAPMVAHESTFGVVFLGTTAFRVLTERESQLIEAAANQVATQVYNAQLYYETHNTLRHQLEQTSLIRDIVERISSSRDFNATIQDVFEAAARTTQADIVRLALRTEVDDLWVIEQTYSDGKSERLYSQQPSDAGIAGEVMQHGNRVLVLNGLRSATPDTVYTSWLAIPLQWDNLIVGVLSVGSLQADFFNETQVDFLKNLGSHTIISIQNERLLDELTYQVEVLTSLRSLSLSLSKVLDTRSAALRVIETATGIMQSQYAAIYQTNRQPAPPSLLEQTTYNDFPLSPPQSLVISHLVEQVASSGQIKLVENANMVYGSRLPDGIPYNYLVAAPIKRGDHVYHILCLGFTEQQRLTELELNTLSLLAVQASAHLENAGLNEEIHDVNSRLRAILDSTRDGVILLDDSGHIIEVNPSAERLMGINLREHINENLASILLQYSESSTDKQAGYSREELMKLARITRLGPQGITRREFTRKINLNQMLYIEEVGSPVIDDTNHLVGRLMVLRDITEEKKLEEYRNEITGMAVHDLRAPLSAIINALQIASERIDTPSGIPVVKRTIEMGLNNADDMLTQVNTLLDIRKGREMTLDRAATQIEEVIELARLRLITSAEKANIIVEVIIPPELPPVNIDPSKIGRVFQNLIDNAIRFTPAGKPIRISVDHWGSKGKLLVRVADSGPGIPEKERGRVFEQYWQSKKNRPLRGSKGSGIGLAFCKLALEAHGERIWIDPVSPLPGACFAFTLPVA
ncbi:MAG: GAF domain-containing protein [Anaerolineaceae bacterium]|nr:GAF domain-containing protein [Anaerolineaceae bacterium]